MRLFKPTYKANGGQLKESPRWWLDFFWNRRRCKVPALSSQRQSEAMGRRFDELMAVLSSGDTPDASLARWAQNLSPALQARMVKLGLLDGRFASAGKPLLEHVAAWEKVLLAKGNTPGHVARYKADVGRIVEMSKAKHLVDLTPSHVQRAIAAMRDGDAETPGVSLQRCNHVLRAVKSFTRWMVADRRATEDALAHLKAFNVQTDRRRVRRALSDDELRRLLDTAKAGNPIFGMSGEDRAMLYRLALGTGFRANELRSLTPTSFSLDAETPTVTVQAGSSKRRRQDVQPIRTDLADVLRPWLNGKPTDAPAFATLPSRYNMAKMLRRDLAAARAAWLAETKDNAERQERSASDFLAATDASGRVVDFHAQRHTYITRLVQSGASVKVAQELARHSTPTLTLNHYSHLGLHDTSAALDALPSLTPMTPTPQAQQLRKTGTDDLPTDLTSPTNKPRIHLDAPLATPCILDRISSDSDGSEMVTSNNAQVPENPSTCSKIPGKMQTSADVAQWQSNGFVNHRLRVRLPPSAVRESRGKCYQISYFQALEHCCSLSFSIRPNPMKSN